MNFENRTVTLKDGRTCTLRPTCPDDAEVMIEYMKVTAGKHSLSCGILTKSITH